MWECWISNRIHQGKLEVGGEAIHKTGTGSGERPGDDSEKGMSLYKELLDELKAL